MAAVRSKHNNLATEQGTANRLKANKPKIRGSTSQGTCSKFYFSVSHVCWRDDLNWWRVGGGEMTSRGGEVVGGEVTCGGEMVGGESTCLPSWWRDDWIPMSFLP